MRIAVIDGQGGGMGKAIIDKIRSNIDHNISIIALGTNSSATSTMMRAGADDGATGANAIIYNVNRCDVIVGAIGIIAANSFHGELSPEVANAVAESEAIKILVPINKLNMIVAGTKDSMLSKYIEDSIQILSKLRKEKNL